MKPVLSIFGSAAFITCALQAAPSNERPAVVPPSAVVPAAVTGLSQALRRADLAFALSGVEMRHLQGSFGERLADGYLNRGAEWSSLRQTLGRQGIDLLHVKVLPGGRIADTMISEVKTGSSRLGQTQTGTQMSRTWKASWLLKISARYQGLTISWEKSPPLIESIPKGLSPKQLLDIPLGGGTSATVWRENSLATWKIDPKGAELGRVKTQVRRLSQHLEAVAQGVESHRSRVIRLGLDAKNIHLTVKDAAGMATGTKESQLPVLLQLEMPNRSANAVGNALQKALETELRRSQPLLTDREVKDQASEMVSRHRRQMLTDVPRKPWGKALRQATTAGAWSGLATGALDAAFQYVDTGSVEHSRSGAFALAGAGSAVAGRIAGTITTYVLINTQSGLALTRNVATAMGHHSTSYTANLLGAASGAGTAAIGLPYLLYFMGQVDIITANRMAVGGGIGLLAGAGAAWAATSLIATYGVAGTGAAIASLSGAAASSATLAWIGGGSVAAGTALSWTGVGLIAVGAGAVANWSFEAWDQKSESERLWHVARHLSQHWHKEVNAARPSL